MPEESHETLEFRVPANIRRMREIEKSKRSRVTISRSKFEQATKSVKPLEVKTQKDLNTYLHEYYLFGVRRD